MLVFSLCVSSNHFPEVFFFVHLDLPGYAQVWVSCPDLSESRRTHTAAFGHLQLDVPQTVPVKCVPG